jgi:hypothetical protein
VAGCGGNSTFYIWTAIGGGGSSWGDKSVVLVVVVVVLLVQGTTGQGLVDPVPAPSYYGGGGACRGAGAVYNAGAGKTSWLNGGYYAYGGPGGVKPGASNGTPANNWGCGGGGGNPYLGSAVAGGAGYQGLVIVRYVSAGMNTGSGGSISYGSGYTYRFPETGLCESIFKVLHLSHGLIYISIDFLIANLIPSVRFMEMRGTTEIYYIASRRSMARMCKDALSWVALKIADGAYPFFANQYKVKVDLALQVQELHNAGIKIFGWHTRYPIGI